MAADMAKKIHMVGIGGVGMSGIACVLKEMGKQVTGSDLHTTDVTQRLQDRDIAVFRGHSLSNVADDTDLVVVSSAIPQNNPEVQKARTLGIPVIKRGDMLALLVNAGQGIAVSGAHGKTTTTSMIAMALQDNGMDPSFIIGGELKDSHLGARLGKGRHFVVEADESDASFLKINSQIAVVTNVEDDHLDFYHSVERIKDAFRQFISQVKTGGFAVLYGDDPFLYGMRDEFRHLVFYGSVPRMDYYYTDLRTRGWESSFKVWHHENCLGTCRMNVPGQHNVLNALATVAVGTEIGVPFDGISRSLAHFEGAKRRFQVLGQVSGITVVDDYAHHPTEIAVTIKAMRQLKCHRVIVVYQPHRYSRTKLLGEHFGEAFKGTDLLIVTDIYGAGETPIAGITGEIIWRSALEQGCNAIYIPEGDNIEKYLVEELRDGDMVVFMGAGDIWKSGCRLINTLEGLHPSA